MLFRCIFNVLIFTSLPVLRFATFHNLSLMLPYVFIVDLSINIPVAERLAADLSLTVLATCVWRGRDSNPDPHIVHCTTKQFKFEVPNKDK